MHLSGGFLKISLESDIYKRLFIIFQNTNQAKIFNGSVCKVVSCDTGNFLNIFSRSKWMCKYISSIFGQFLFHNKFKTLKWISMPCVLSKSNFIGASLTPWFELNCYRSKYFTIYYIYMYILICILIYYNFIKIINYTHFGSVHKPIYGYVPLPGIGSVLLSFAKNILYNQNLYTNSDITESSFM